MSSPSNSTCLSPKKKASLREDTDADPTDVSHPTLTSSTKKRKMELTERTEVVTEEAKLRVQLLSEFATAPKRASSGAAGYDLVSAYDCVVEPRGRSVVKTDIAVALPEGTYGRIAPRSGLAVKAGIDVGGGVIDVDYRGAIGVVLFNHSDDKFEVKCGDRVAQLVIEVIRTPQVEVVEELTKTERGERGFGSTGVATDVTNTVESK